MDLWQWQEKSIRGDDRRKTDWTEMEKGNDYLDSVSKLQVLPVLTLGMVRSPGKMPV